MNFDSAVNGGNNGGGTGHSFSFNNVGGNIVFIDVLGDNINGGVDDITSVTYSGIACTLVAQLSLPSGSSGDPYKYLFKLVGAPTGNNTVAISATNAHLIQAEAASYSGASDVDTVITNYDLIGNQTSLTTLITPIVSGCWVICFETGYNGNPPPAAGTGLVSTRVVDASFGANGTFDTNGTVPAGVPYSVTTTRSSPPTSWIQHIVVSLAPAGGTLITVLEQGLDQIENPWAVVSY